MTIKNFIHKKVMETLAEAYQTGHFVTRVKNRINGIYDIRVSPDFYGSGDKELLKKGVITKVKELLHARVQNMSSYTFPSENYDTIVAKLGKLFVKKDGVEYPLTVLTRYMEGEKEEEKIGNMFIAQIYNDRLVTLILSHTDKSDEALIKAHVDNLTRRGDIIGNTAVTSKFNNPIVVNLDGEKTTAPKEPVTPAAKDKTILSTKKGYRKGMTYDHPTLGSGKIMSSYQFLPNESLVSSLMKNYDTETNNQIKNGNVDFFKIVVQFENGNKTFIVPAVKEVA